MQTAPHPHATLLASDPDGWTFWAWELPLTLKAPWAIARGTADSKRNLVVAVARDGLIGLGEVAPNVRFDETFDGCWDAARTLADACLSIPIWGYRALADRFPLVTGYGAVKAAFDSALLDWHGQKAGLPLHAMLGLAGRPGPLTSYSIGLTEPEAIARKIEAAAPYPILKVKLGGPDDRAVMATVRSLTDKPIRVDANEGWVNAYQALEMIRFLEDLDVELIEQPLPAKMLEEARWLREKTRIPLIADESTVIPDFTRLKGAFDGVNIKLSKAGGIQGALQQIGTARALGLKVMIGCMIESSLGITAAAQLGALADYLDLDGHLLVSDDPYAGAQVEQGAFRLPEAPGLGVARRG